MNIFSRRPFGGESHDEGVDAKDIDDERRSGKLVEQLGRRNVVLGSVVLLVLIIGFGCWLAFGAIKAKSNLEDARSYAQQAKDALLQGDTDKAARAAAGAETHARGARDATHSLPWNIAAAIPWLGSPFKSGQEITDVVQGLASDVLSPAAQIGSAISPDRLYLDGRVDVETLRQQEPQLSEMSVRAARLDATAQAITDPSYLSSLKSARTQIQSQASDLASMLENTALAARLAPAMMGLDGPRTYFMGFQTNAEARGTGGLLGGFGVLRFVNGKPSVDALAPNTELDKQFTPIDLGPEYAEQYGFADPTTDYRNSNLSSHFPYTAQIWKSLWAQQTGTNVDGVIAIDPVALSYILGAVGPITMPDGERVTKDNVVELTESTTYVRYPTDQAARKQYLQDIANEVVKKTTGRVESPRKLLDALGRSVSERRIAVWSSLPDEQALLGKTPLAHAIPNDAAPYAEVVINNLGGNKLDYYLQRDIEYVADGCTGETRMSTVTVRLANRAPNTDLPEYVAGSLGLLRDLPVKVPSGTMLTSVRLVGTKGAKLVSALANGQKAPVFTGTEMGHPTFEVQVAIPSGKSGELTFRLSEPTAPGAARVPVQPLVDPATPKVMVPHCR